MKVMVISDTHGLVEEVEEAIQHFRPEKILHCGDFCVPANQAPFSGMIKVMGNCDFAKNVPLERTLKWHGLKVWMTHGHKWRVKEDLLPLSYRAEEVGAHIVLFGHSHFPLSLFENGRLFVNPGSFSRPRGYPQATLVMMDLEPDAGMMAVNVTFYNRRFQKVNDRGGKYRIQL